MLVVFTREAIILHSERRNQSIDGLLGNLIISGTVFSGDLNNIIRPGNLYPIEELFHNSLEDYIFSNMPNAKRSCPFENKSELRVVSHRTYSVLFRLGVIVEKTNSNDFPHHYADILGWKIRQRDMKLFAEYNPSNWY